ncbi:MAG: hypothetical protein V4819_16030 [Verrucomicrobiota bacterium]
MATASLSASDGFVIAMLAMMALSLCVLIVLAICMRRNVARRNRQVDELLEEVAAEEARENRARAVADTPAREPWEKDGDWWKQ